jgi:hypothetical protein
MKTAGFELRTVFTLFASLTLFASKAAPLLDTNNANNTNRVKMKKGRELKLGEKTPSSGRSGARVSPRKNAQDFFKNNLRFLFALFAASNHAGLRANSLPVRRFTLFANFRAEKSTKSGFLTARAGR